MRSEAIKLSGFTIVLSAVGFLIRWLQDMRIANAETGLPANAPITWLLAIVLIAVAAVLFLLVKHLRQFEAPMTGDYALKGHTPVYGAISLLPAILLGIAGLVRVLHPGDVLWTMTHRICGVATLLGALGSGIIAVNAAKPDKMANCRKGAVLMLIFACFWLITGYRDAAGDPIVWRFLVGILARCAVLLSIFYLCGWFYNSPHPWLTIFSCNFAAFLCIMSAIDNSTLAESITYAGMATQLLIWGFVPVENLRTRAFNAEEEE